MFKKGMTYHFIIVILAVFLLTTVSVNAENEKNLSVNNQWFNGLSLVSASGEIMASAEEFASQMGYKYSYDTGSSVTIISNDKEMMEIRLQPDNKIAVINGQNFEMPEKTMVKDMRIMIPAGFIAGVLGAEVFTNPVNNVVYILKATEGEYWYQVHSGDTLWILSSTFHTGIARIKSENGLSSDMIYSGQWLKVAEEEKVSRYDYEAYTSKSATVFMGTDFDSGDAGYLKPWTGVTITGRMGNWFKADTPIGEGYLYSSILYLPQEVNVDGSTGSYFNGYIPVDTSKDSINYTAYTVVKGDTIWTVATEYGITMNELAEANNIPPDSYLSIGQILKLPEHDIAVREPAREGYGEILDWFEEAQYLLPIGKTAKVFDIETGNSFMIKRTIGSAHADVETLTKEDTNIMKEIFGGTWSWNRRPCFLEVDGRRLAISISGMPHAGVDGVPFLQDVDNRSDDWGYGSNYDSISGNGMDGHFDLYFLNCLRHKDNNYDSVHQMNVLIAGGMY